MQTVWPTLGRRVQHSPLKKQAMWPWVGNQAGHMIQGVGQYVIRRRHEAATWIQTRQEEGTKGRAG